MAGRMTNEARTNCRYRFGGGVKMRDLGGGIKAHRNGEGSRVADMAKGKNEGIVGDAGIGTDGLPAKKSLARPGRKFGGRTEGKTESEAESDAHMKDDKADYKDGGEPKRWMQGAVKHPGALHRALGVPMGEKIPAKKLAKAAHSDDPSLKRKAVLAETFKKARG